MQTESYHEPSSENHEFLPIDKNFCQICAASLNEVGGTNARFILPSGTIEHFPMCFKCEVDVDHRIQPTLGAFARELAQIVIERHSTKGGAL